jgi:hypothetical protein
VRSDSQGDAKQEQNKGAQEDAKPMSRSGAVGSPTYSQRPLATWTTEVWLCHNEQAWVFGSTHD